MQKTFTTVALDVIDSLPNFFAKLKEFIGDFSIEGMSSNCRDSIIVSFYTDVVQFEEGEGRDVNILARHIGNEWEFVKIEKLSQ